MIGLPYHMALRKYGQNIKRAYDYRGLNYKLMMSEADIIKRSMLAAYDAGVFEVIGMPILQVHDEIGMSVIDDSPIQNEAYRELHRIMEHTTPALVPITIEAKRGPTWGKID
jgi:DNA polymerase I-like protein with 3'-5' exonuclease and polymerase domains